MFEYSSDVKLIILVTFMMFVMVFFMPYVDRKLCNRLGIVLDDSLSKNPNADRLLRLRKIILIFIFGVYVMMVLYVAFFSRSAANDYLIHIALFEDFANAIKIDFGILSFIRTIFTDGFKEAVTHVKLNKIEDIYQVYLNIAMFVPMGYLLPYVFDWFRRHIRFRTVVTCFLISFVIENLQLITKVGFYDVDDLVSNTIGAYIGQGLYVLFAYFLTHPDFRKELKRMKRWRNRAHKRAIYPFFSKIHVLRVTLFASNKEEVFDFYENKLGFRLRRLIPYQDDSYFLFDFGKNQIEVLCNPKYKDLPMQKITIACNNSEYLKKNLEKHSIETSDYGSDIYTGLRTFSFMGPDNTMITIIEE